MLNSYLKIKVIIHEAEEGCYWSEVPTIPGCMTQGETFDELLTNIYETVEGCLFFRKGRFDASGTESRLLLSK